MMNPCRKVIETQNVLGKKNFSSLSFSSQTANASLFHSESIFRPKRYRKKGLAAKVVFFSSYVTVCMLFFLTSSIFPSSRSTVKVFLGFLYIQCTTFNFFLFHFFCLRLFLFFRVGF